MAWFDLDTLLARADLPEVAQKLGIELQRSGSGYVALCPFHPDTKSLSVDGSSRCCPSAPSTRLDAEAWALTSQSDTVSRTSIALHSAVLRPDAARHLVYRR